MLQHPTPKPQVSEFTEFRQEIARLNQQLEVLQTCRAHDSQTFQSFQLRIVRLQREAAAREARIAQLEQELETVKQHLNPEEKTG